MLYYARERASGRARSGVAERGPNRCDFDGCFIYSYIWEGVDNIVYGVVYLFGFKNRDGRKLL